MSTDSPLLRWVERERKWITEDIDPDARSFLAVEERLRVLAIIEAAEKLQRKLEEVHADHRYQAVWHMYMIHGGNYTEPKYEKELVEHKSALDALRKEIENG